MSEVEYTKMEGRNLPPGGYPPQEYPQNVHLPIGENSPYPLADTHQTNEVAAGQPISVPLLTHDQKEVVSRSPPARDFLIFTIVTIIVLGIFGGGIGALVAAPALIFSLVARSKNNLGNTQEARNFGLLALCWNIAVIIYHVILWIVIIAIIVVNARGGLSSTAASPSSGGNSGSESTCTLVLTQVCYTYSCGYKYVYKCS